MRKALVAITVILALLAGSTLAVAHYQDYKNKQTRAQLSAVQVLSVKVGDLQAQYQSQNDALVAKYNGERTECEKGLAAYGALTPTLKAQRSLSQPICGTAL